MSNQISGPVCPQCGSNGPHSILSYYDKIFAVADIHCMTCEESWVLEQQLCKVCGTYPPCYHD